MAGSGQAVNGAGDRSQGAEPQGTESRRQETEIRATERQNHRTTERQQTEDKPSRCCNTASQRKLFDAVLPILWGGRLSDQFQIQD